MSFHSLPLDPLTDFVAALKLSSVGRTFARLLFHFNSLNLNMLDFNMKGFS